MEFSTKICCKANYQYTSMNFCLVTKMGHTNSTSDFDGVIQSLLDCVLSSTVYVAHAFLSKASKFKSSSVFGKMQVVKESKKNNRC